MKQAVKWGVMALTLEIPGFGELYIAQIVFDLNGTLGQNGIIADSTREKLRVLGEQVTLHVISADTHGTLERVIAGLPIQARRIRGALGAAEKVELVRTLGAQRTLAVGNGRNDVEMLKLAAVGIAVSGPEGLARDALLAADIVFPHIDDALDSLLQPRRLLATLRG